MIWTEFLPIYASAFHLLTAWIHRIGVKNRVSDILRNSYVVTVADSR